MNTTIPRALPRIDHDALVAAAAAAEAEIESLAAAAAAEDAESLAAQRAFEAAPSAETVTARDVTKQLARNAHKAHDDAVARHAGAFAGARLAAEASAHDAAAGRYVAASGTLITAINGLLELHGQAIAAIVAIESALRDHADAAAELRTRAGRLESIGIVEPVVPSFRSAEQVRRFVCTIFGLKRSTHGAEPELWLAANTSIAPLSSTGSVAAALAGRSELAWERGAIATLEALSGEALSIDPAAIGDDEKIDTFTIGGASVRRRGN